MRPRSQSRHSKPSISQAIVNMFGILRPNSPDHEHRDSPQDASPPPPQSLAPMPTSTFNSREELLEGCKNWSSTQGFATVIARSRVNRLWLKCDRGGTYENRRNLLPDQRKRRRTDSRLLGCPFKMIASRSKDSPWKVHTVVPNHNHGPSDDLSAHPTLRRMTDQQLQRVHEMCDAGKSPAETLEELKATWPDIKVLTRDIYNARKKYKTLKEEAEAAAGQQEEQQPYQDPNELGFRGPSSKGRWAWVADGEEVINKQSKKKRKSAPVVESIAPSTLDPQLQTPEPPRATQQPASTGRLVEITRTGSSDRVSPHDPAQQGRRAQLRFQRSGSTANELQSTLFPETINIHSNSNRKTRSTNQAQLHAQSSPAPQPVVGPSHIPPPVSAAPQAIMSSTPTTSDNNAPGPKPGEPRAQVLMSRIERMEKEQRNQQNMLAQILGAVQGFQKSPSLEA